MSRILGTSPRADPDCQRIARSSKRCWPSWTSHSRSTAWRARSPEARQVARTVEYPVAGAPVVCVGRAGDGDWLQRIGVGGYVAMALTVAPVAM